MRREFTIEPADWAELVRLSHEALNMPVMALSLADGLAGRDFASQAREAVMRVWSRLGRKYGFHEDTTEPVNESERRISAIVREPDSAF